MPRTHVRHRFAPPACAGAVFTAASVQGAHARTLPPDAGANPPSSSRPWHSVSASTQRHAICGAPARIRYHQTIQSGDEAGRHIERWDG
jgi:hypothetical protein